MRETDQERNRREPIQPHYVSDGTAGVAVSLPLNKERIERDHVDLFSYLNVSHWHSVRREWQKRRGRPMRQPLQFSQSCERAGTSWYLLCLLKPLFELERILAPRSNSRCGISHTPKKIRKWLR